MSKTKGTKRKSSSLQKPNSKLPTIKVEPESLDETESLKNANDSKNVNDSNQSGLSNKKIAIKTETSGSCTEASCSNRESTDIFCSYMKNAILEEVLNAKKAALLQSPSILKLLREEQLKKQKKD